MSESHFCEAIGGRLSYAASDCGLCDSEEADENARASGAPAQCVDSTESRSCQNGMWKGGFTASIRSEARSRVRFRSYRRLTPGFTRKITLINQVNRWLSLNSDIGNREQLTLVTDGGEDSLGDGTEQIGFWRYEEASAVCLRHECGWEESGPLHRLKGRVDEHVGDQRHPVRIVTDEDALGGGRRV